MVGKLILLVVVYLSVASAIHNLEGTWETCVQSTGAGTPFLKRNIVFGSQGATVTVTDTWYANSVDECEGAALTVYSATGTGVTGTEGAGAGGSTTIDITLSTGTVAHTAADNPPTFSQGSCPELSTELGSAADDQTVDLLNSGCSAAAAPFRCNGTIWADLVLLSVDQNTLNMGSQGTDFTSNGCGTADRAGTLAFSFARQGAQITTTPAPATTPGTTSNATTPATTPAVTTTTPVPTPPSSVGPVTMSLGGEDFIVNGFFVFPQAATADPGLQLAEELNVFTIQSDRLLDYDMNIVISQPAILGKPTVTNFPETGTIGPTQTRFSIFTPCDPAQNNAKGFSRVELHINFPNSGLNGLHVFWRMACNDPTAQVQHDFFVENVCDTCTNDFLINGGKVTEPYSILNVDTALTTADNAEIRWGVNNPYQLGWFNLTSSDISVVDPVVLGLERNPDDQPYIGHIDGDTVGGRAIIPVQQSCLKKGEAVITFSVKIDGFEEVLSGSYYRDCGAASALFIPLFFTFFLALLSLF